MNNYYNRFGWYYSRQSVDIIIVMYIQFCKWSVNFIEILDLPDIELLTINHYGEFETTNSAVMVCGTGHLVICNVQFTEPPDGELQTHMGWFWLSMISNVAVISVAAPSSHTHLASTVNIPGCEENYMYSLNNTLPM